MMSTGKAHNNREYRVCSDIMLDVSIAVYFEAFGLFAGWFLG